MTPAGSAISCRNPLRNRENAEVDIEQNFPGQAKKMNSHREREFAANQAEHENQAGPEPDQVKNFIFFQKIKCPTIPVLHFQIDHFQIRAISN